MKPPHTSPLLPLHELQARTAMKRHCAPPFIYCWRIFSRCFTVKKLMSNTRSTQLARHVSSLLSSLPPRIVPVMHFFQHTSVSACVSTPPLASFRHYHSVRGPPTTDIQLALGGQRSMTYSPGPRTSWTRARGTAGARPCPCRSVC